MIPSIRHSIAPLTTRPSALRFGQDNQNQPPATEAAPNANAPAVSENTPNPVPSQSEMEKAQGIAGALAGMVGFAAAFANPIAAALLTRATAQQIANMPQPKMEPERIKV